MGGQHPNTTMPRDRWGRPMVMPPNGKNRMAYQRTTTFVGVMENTFNLMAWKQRMTVLGIGQRRDLQLAAAAADPDDKKTLNDLADKAMEAANASAAATTGTALHSLTERVDRGQELGYVPPEYADDIKAYAEATKHIEWTGIEQFRVHDEFKVAGTADRVGWYNGRLVVLDVKSGSIDYPHKMSMQLAMYSRSTPYDIENDQRITDPGEIDLTTGVILHLPAGQGRCDLYEIDIARGWEACVLAREVHAWRNSKDLTRPVGPAMSAERVERLNTVTSNGVTRLGDLIPNLPPHQAMAKISESDWSEDEIKERFAAVRYELQAAQCTTKSQLKKLWDKAKSSGDADLKLQALFKTRAASLKR